MSEKVLKLTKNDNGITRVSLVSNGYYVYAPKMTWAGRIGKDKVSMLTDTHTCRETFVTALCKGLNNEKFNGRTFDPVMSKMYILLSKTSHNGVDSVEIVDSEFDSGLRAVHLAESVMLLPKSVMYNVDIKSLFDDKCSPPVKGHNHGKATEAINRTKVVLLSGSRRWMRSVPLMSLYLLLFRLGVVTHTIGTDINEYKSLDDLLSDIKSMAVPDPSKKQNTSEIFKWSKIPNYEEVRRSYAASHVASVLKSVFNVEKAIKVVLEKHDVLFKELPEKTLKNGSGSNGIYKWATGMLASDKSYKRYKEMITNNTI